MKYQSFITLMLFHKPYQFSVTFADLVNFFIQSGSFPY